MPIIAPSILSADFAHIADEVKRVESAGADEIHIDVMDGAFVPNITIGPQMVAAINRSTDLFLDVHLMIYTPFDYVERFLKAGADRITFHFEATEDISETIAFIKKCNVEVGLAFCPETSESLMIKYLDMIDLLLVMTVKPGFGGQAFMPEMLEKVRLARKLGGDKLKIQVDGGINFETGRQAVEAGADHLVAGTYLFEQEDMGVAISKMRT